MKSVKSSAAYEKNRPVSATSAFPVPPAFNSCPTEVLETKRWETERSSDRPICEPSNSNNEVSNLARFVKFLIRFCVGFPETMNPIAFARSRKFFYERERDHYIKNQEERRAEITFYARRF